MTIVVQGTHTEVVLENEVGLKQIDIKRLLSKVNCFVLLGDFQSKSRVFREEDRSREYGSFVPQKPQDLSPPDSANCFL